jgi:hypothetical protein
MGEDAGKDGFDAEQRLILDQELPKASKKKARLPVYALALGVISLFLFITLLQPWIFASSVVFMLAGLIHGRWPIRLVKDQIYWSAVLACGVFVMMYLGLIVRYFFM